MCLNLGAYVDWNGSTSSPAYEVIACDDHPLATIPAECIEHDDAAAMRVDECLHAIAEVRDILWPDGRADASWSPDSIDAIAQRLAFLAPKAVRS
jgi:hypothetical protein